MAMSPNVASGEQQTSVEPRHIAAFDAYLTFCALGGIITTDTGKLETLTQDQFCDAYGISPRTCQRWKKTSDFAMKVRERRSEIVPLARETAAWNRLYLLGMQNQDKRAAVDALKTYLGHFGQLEEPVKRSEVEIHGSAAELLMAARRDGIIEGEVVNATAEADTGGNAPDASALPSPS